MVAPAIPLIYWGIGILLAGGAAITARRILEEEEIGRIELPDILTRNSDPEPEPEPEREQPKPFPPPFDYDTETRAKERCEDNPEQDCEMCKPAQEGSPFIRSFAGGTVQKPSPAARGALYQHHVVGWFVFQASADDENKLTVGIQEWNWKLGRLQSWDGLVFSQCRLLECKLGYRDFLDQNAPNYRLRNPRKPFLGTLQNAFRPQLFAQYAAMMTEWPRATLEWVFSDDEVNWQFVAMCRDRSYWEVKNRHVPYHLAPSGTEFVRELYADGSEDTYGYWEDS